VRLEISIDLNDHLEETQREGPADHRRCLQDPARRLWEGVQTGLEDPLQRVRDARHAGHATLLRQ